MTVVGCRLMRIAAATGMRTNWLDAHDGERPEWWNIGIAPTAVRYVD
jgi:hypothetical protein